MTRRMTRALVLVLGAALPGAVLADFDASAYFMDEMREIAMAKSAAPDFVSADATVMVLRQGGFQTVIEGANGFVCLVLRSWGESNFAPERAYDPTTLDPECLNPEAVRTILPMQLYRTELGLAGTPPEEIKSRVQRGFRSGRFARTEQLSFSYMLSTAMTKHPPHIMFYLPDGSTDATFGNTPSARRYVYVIGGDDEPYIAGVVLQRERGIDPAY